MFDVAFIGGGLACTFTWEALLRSVEGRRLSFAMFDRDGSLGTGVPYGTYADPAYLLNDWVAANDSGDHALGWIAWLRADKSRWLAPLEASDDPAVQRWLVDNRDAIDRDQLERRYLPRCVFGQFLRERFARHLARVEEAGHRFELFSTEVTDVEREADGTFTIAHGTTRVRARTVLIGIGLPVGNRWPHLNAVPGYLSIHDVHTTRLADRIRAIAPGNDRLDVGILGGGPSAVEMAYRWLTHPELASRLGRMILVTTSGDIPHVGTARSTEAAFEPPRLTALADGGPTDAAHVFEAVRADLAHIRATETPWLFALPNIFGKMAASVQRFSLEEKRRFLREYAEPIVSLVKSTSMDYEQLLRGDARLSIRAGRVGAVSRAGDRFELAIAEGANETRELVDVVINCLGTTDLRTTESRLLSRLLERGLVELNPGGRGVQIDESFAASPNLFVLGPLLSGTCNSTFICMRMESITRTLGCAPGVAAGIAAALG